MISMNDNVVCLNTLKFELSQSTSQKLRHPSVFDAAETAFFSWDKVNRPSPSPPDTQWTISQLPLPAQIYVLSYHIISSRFPVSHSWRVLHSPKEHVCFFQEDFAIGWISAMRPGDMGDWAGKRETGTWAVLSRVTEVGGIAETMIIKMLWLNIRGDPNLHWSIQFCRSKV